MRAKEVWVHAVDLDNGGSFLDFPTEMVDEIIADVLRAWTRRGEPGAVALRATDRDLGAAEYGEGGPTVEGAAPDLARWLTGRGARRLRVVAAATCPRSRAGSDTGALSASSSAGDGRQLHHASERCVARAGEAPHPPGTGGSSTTRPSGV